MLDKIQRLHNIASRRTAIPIATFIKIDHGQCYATDLSMTLSLSVPELSGIHCCVPADKFLQAVGAIDGVPATVIQRESTLEIKAGKFRTTIDVLSAEEFPVVAPPPKGEATKIKFIPALKTLAPFMHDKPQFTNIHAVHLGPNGGEATNGVTCLRIPLDGFDRGIIIPSSSVNMLIKNGTEPVSFHISTRGDEAFNLAMWLNDTDFCCVQLVDAKFPDIDRLFAMCDFSTVTKIPESLKNGVRVVSKFTGDDHRSISFSGTTLFTTTSEFEVDEPLNEAKWNGDNLTAVLELAVEADFSCYPKPCPWVGANGERGVIAGLRKE